MTITAQTVITAAGLLGAIGAILAVYNKGYDLYKRQGKQDKAIKELQKNDAAVMAALLGVLEGLIEQGCNGAVHKARDELQSHILKRSNSDDP